MDLKKHADVISDLLFLYVLMDLHHSDTDDVRRVLDLVAVSADIPDDTRIGYIEVSDLPKNWRSYPVPEELQDLGTAWVTSASAAVLVIPSAVIPEERNYLLNPAHPDFKRFRLNKPEAFHFDPRMWK